MSVYLTVGNAIDSKCTVGSVYIEKGSLSPAEVSKIQDKVSKLKVKIFTQVITNLKSFGKIKSLDEHAFKAMVSKKTDLELLVIERTEALNELVIIATKRAIDRLRPKDYVVREFPSDGEDSFSYRMCISRITDRCIGLESSDEENNLIIIPLVNDEISDTKKKFQNALEAEIAFISDITYSSGGFF